MNLKSLAIEHLGRSNVDKRHPFRTCWLSTISEYPDVRTVIKRRWYDEGRVLIFTDSRSEKVTQLKKYNRAALVFYHPRHKLQVRMRCQADLIESGHKEYQTLKEIVLQSPSVGDYTSAQVPGSVLGEERVEYRDELYFTAIDLHVVEMDIVLLRKEGHLRSRLTRANGDWIETPLIP